MLSVFLKTNLRELRGKNFWVMIHQRITNSSPKIYRELIEESPKVCKIFVMVFFHWFSQKWTLNDIFFISFLTTFQKHFRQVEFASWDSSNQECMHNCTIKLLLTNCSLHTEIFRPQFFVPTSFYSIRSSKAYGLNILPYGPHNWLKRAYNLLILML